MRDTITYLPDLRNDPDSPWPAVFSDGCIVNLDKITSNYAPLILSEGEFVYPEVTNAFGERLITISKQA